MQSPAESIAAAVAGIAAAAADIAAAAAIDNN